MRDYHHAVLFRNGLVNSLEVPLAPGTDVNDVYIPRFGIDDARELVRLAHHKPAESTHQTLIVRTDFITVEAQNALLKVLEEPPESTGFVFVVPEHLSLLTTLLSRFSEQSVHSGDGSNDDHNAFKDFITREYKERLGSIELAVKGKDQEWIQAMKQGLIAYLKDEGYKCSSFQELEYVARKLLLRGASNKMLLEHLALILPIRSETQKMVH